MSLRLITALHTALNKSAAKNQRSLQGEIVFALIEYVRKQGFEITEKDLQEMPKPRKRRTYRAR